MNIRYCPKDKAEPQFEDLAVGDCFANISNELAKVFMKIEPGANCNAISLRGARHRFDSTARVFPIEADLCWWRP